MSNSTTTLDLIAASQSQKEVTANAMFDAASPAMLYGRRASTTAGLTWGFYGGCITAAGAPVDVANGTVTLTASATNYVEADATTGAVSANTSAFTAGKIPLYEIVVGASTVTSYLDKRSLASMGGTAGDPAGTAADLMADHLAAADPHPGYLTQAEADLLYLTGVPDQPYDLTSFYPGVPTASAIAVRVPVARTLNFPANFAGSYATASIAATAATIFAVQKNGVEVGTITFAIGASTATFATTGGTAVAFAAGDIFAIIAPGTADATLANIGIVVTGLRAG